MTSLLPSNDPLSQSNERNPDVAEVQLMMEIGFLAVGSNRFGDAERIFTGIQSVRPDSELPLIGRAVVRMAAEKIDDAIQLLQMAVQKNEDSFLAMSFLGTALQMANYNSAATDVLQQVIDADHKQRQKAGEHHSSDRSYQAAVDLAQSLLCLSSEDQPVSN